MSFSLFLDAFERVLPIHGNPRKVEYDVDIDRPTFLDAYIDGSRAVCRVDLS